MTTTTTKLTIIAAALLFSTIAHAAGTAINETGEMPDESAILDARSVTRGFLPPRMTAVQKNAIPAPAVGLMVYQTDGTTGLYVFDGTVWKQAGSSATGTVTDVTATAPLASSGGATPVISLTGTIPDSNLAVIATAGKVANSATTAASANTASAIVTRDASGNFSAGTVTANLTGNVTGNVTGNADTATAATSATTANSATTAGNVTGTVAVANGGTGTTDGSITGTGALAFTAGGTNQNVMLTPSGTGNSLLGGNMGMGTTTPQYKIDVMEATGTDIQPLGRFSAGGNATGNGSSIVLGSTQTHAAYISGVQTTSNSGDIVLGTQSAGNYSERMRINSTGNVGIGTTTPGYKLDVNGAINATGITVNGTPVASSTDTYWSTAGAGSIQYSGGNVGINKATPAYTLDVGGNVNVSGNFMINGTPLSGTGTVTSVAGSGGTTGLTLAGGPITTSGTLTLGGTLAVANGGTGTATGSITGTGALTFAAGGTNQNVTLTPSGTGYTQLDGNVCMGRCNTGTRLNILDASTVANSYSLYITKTGTITGNAYGVSATVSGASVWNEALQGITSGTGTDNAGVYALASGAGTGTTNYGTYSRAMGSTGSNFGTWGRAEGSVGYTYGGYFTNTATTTGSKYGLVASASGASTGANYGGHFSATNSGGAAYALVTSVGNVGIGTITPAYLLDVAGDVNTTGTYRVNGTTIASVNGTGALTFAAGGTNQNVTITPSGTGFTLLGGNTAIGGTTSATDKLRITDTSTTDLSTGLKINKTGAVTGNSYGAHFTVSGGSTWNIGSFAQGSGTGTYNAGFYGSATTAATNNYGIRGDAYTGTINYGVYGSASGATGQTYGGYFDNTATSTIAKYGIVARTTGASTGSSYGGQFLVSNSSGTPNYGVQASTTTTGTNNYGTYSEATGAGTNNIGVAGNASGASEKNYGVYGVVSGATGTSSMAGYFLNQSTTAATSKYGVYSEATGVSTNNNYALNGVASGSTNGNYGVVGVANVATTGKNYGAYFTASNATGGNYALITDQGNVGIGTTTPVSSAILDVSSTTKGFLPPRMTSAQRSAISSPAQGLVVYQTDAYKGIYSYDGAAWQMQSNVIFGDVKQGIQSADHNGWVKLDGRLKSGLTATQQTQATTLGIGTNLPNASNSFLVQNGTTLGSVSGSNTRTIAQNQLPNVTYTGAINQLANGATVLSTASGVFSMVNPGNAGNATGSGPTHNFNLSIPLNGGVTQQALTITPQSLSVNMFIYLGL